MAAVMICFLFLLSLSVFCPLSLLYFLACYLLSLAVIHRLCSTMPSSPSKSVSAVIKTARKRVRKVAVIRSAFLHTKKVCGRVNVWSISKNIKDAPRYLFSRADRKPSQHPAAIQDLISFTCVPFSTIIVNKKHLQVPHELLQNYLNENGSSFKFNGKVLSCEADSVPDPETSEDELEGIVFSHSLFIYIYMYMYLCFLIFAFGFFQKTTISKKSLKKKKKINEQEKFATVA